MHTYMNPVAAHIVHIHPTQSPTQWALSGDQSVFGLQRWPHRRHNDM